MIVTFREKGGEFLEKRKNQRKMDKKISKKRIKKNLTNKGYFKKILSSVLLKTQ